MLKSMKATIQWMERVVDTHFFSGPDKYVGDKKSGSLVPPESVFPLSRCQKCRKMVKLMLRNHQVPGFHKSSYKVGGGRE